MATRFIQVPVHWNDEQAHAVIAFLEQWRNMLIQHYRGPIPEEKQPRQTDRNPASRQIDFIDEPAL